MDPVYAERSATGQYRATPLRALWQHPPYFHDGSAATLDAALRKAGLVPVEITRLDRYRNFTAMTHSMTCGGLFRILAPLFRLARRVAGDVVLRLPLGENLLAVARKP